MLGRHNLGRNTISVGIAVASHFLSECSDEHQRDDRKDHQEDTWAQTHFIINRARFCVFHCVCVVSKTTERFGEWNQCCQASADGGHHPGLHEVLILRNRSERELDARPRAEDSRDRTHATEHRLELFRGLLNGTTPIVASFCITTLPKTT